ncbi:Arm DNA-binding domain-containing protein [uncultured Formosa sp.]|uniref:Arm DNA-binding domain-containing protein n=1 Tax=uncultured Formosa sp. TaxID=255435 RepID=UPI00345A041E
MQTQPTFSVLFWVKQAITKNGKVPLYARITVNGKRAELSLKRKVNILDWDSNKSRVNGLSEESQLLNDYLKQVSAEFFKIY